MGWGLLALAVIDFRTLTLPDRLTVPIIAAGFGIIAIAAPERFANHALAAGAGFVFFAGVALAYEHLRGRPGLGFGDAKLLAAAGAWLGLAVLPLVVFIAALLGLAAAGISALAGRSIYTTEPIPFGPPLALATWVVWLYGIPVAP